MTTTNLEQLKFPVGHFEPPTTITSAHLEEWINDIAQFPSQVEAITANLSDAQKQWIYRPGGWSIKQVVHHCGDSHMNCLIRVKLTLTEDTPTIRPYFEDRWAELVDSQEDDLTHSILLLKAVHHRLVNLFKSLTNEELALEYVHPEHGQTFSLAEVIGTYSWHSRHHYAHIKQALDHGGF